MSVSLVPESWDCLARGTDSGERFAIVARIKHEDVDRLTAWRLAWIRGDWRVTHILFSRENLGLDRVPNRLKKYITPIRLSDSMIDNQLRRLANG